MSDGRKIERGPIVQDTNRVMAAIMVALFLLAAVVMVALADIPGEQELGASLTGPCDGTAQIQNGPLLDPSESAGLYTVPIDGSADYDGSVSGPSDGDERPEANGKVEVETPPLFPNIAVGGAWPGGDNVITGIQEDGTQSWSDLPDWTPRGVPFRVSGFHNDAGGIRCDGFVWLQFEGSTTQSPVVWVTAALTLLWLVLLIGAAGTIMGRDAGRQVMSTIMGLLFGLELGFLLILLGIVPLHSAAPVVLGILGLLMGIAVGLGPKGRTMDLGAGRTLDD